MRSRTSSRGSALLIAVIAVLVLTTIGIAMVRMTGREVAGSLAGEHEQSLSECAEAARVQLFSQLHALGFQPQLVPALRATLIGTKSTSGAVWAMGGHYDTPMGASSTPGTPPPVVIEQVAPLPNNAGGPTHSGRDESNSSSLIGQGGKPIKVVALCCTGALSPSGACNGRDLEVEFGVRFGL